jgi:RimJ/RimL family protein N-acetyltransferase
LNAVLCAPWSITTFRKQKNTVIAVHSFPTLLEPCELQGHGVRLVPLSRDHISGLERAAVDGELWRLRIANVPEPGKMAETVEALLAQREAGTALSFSVIEERSGDIIGTTSYHDILPSLARLEIGHTWYAKSWQRTHVNTACKLLLLTHAFDILNAAVVSWRTDNFNLASQRAIERLGAHRDGVLRHHKMRRDGTVRDTVMYSLLAGEWPEVAQHLHYQLQHHAG